MSARDVSTVLKAIKRGMGRPRPALEQAHRTIQQELRGRPSARSTRPLLIGQAPGPRTHPDLPLFPAPVNSAGGRLFAMTGLDMEDYMRLLDRVNLLYEHPGKLPGGSEDKFPKGKARVAAQAMRPFLRERCVLLVGRDVAEAFGHEEEPWLEWREEVEWGYRYALLPHPSGRNHWYNDKVNHKAASRFLRQWALTLCKPTPG